MKKQKMREMGHGRYAAGAPWAGFLGWDAPSRTQLALLLHHSAEPPENPGPTEDLSVEVGGVGRETVGRCHCVKDFVRESQRE